MPDFIRFSFSFSFSLYSTKRERGNHALFDPPHEDYGDRRAESRRLLIDRSSLIFCQIGRITVRRLNELPRWLSLTSFHGSQKRHTLLPTMLFAKIVIIFNPLTQRKIESDLRNWINAKVRNTVTDTRELNIFSQKHFLQQFFCAILIVFNMIFFFLFCVGFGAYFNFI